MLNEAEPHLIAHFRRRVGPSLSADEIELTRTVWGTLVLMQHYRAHTRLLDWTLSPWVAAFFAARNHAKRNGYVFAFRLRDLPVFDPIEQHVGRLIHVRSMNEWIQCVKTCDEVVAFDPTDLAKPFPYECVKALGPMRATARMVAQQSHFTLGFPITVDQRMRIGNSLQRESKRLIVIPRSAKPELIRILARMNVTAASLFPGIDGAGESIGEIAAFRHPTPAAPVDDWNP